MNEYYQNGPLPTWIGWYAAQLPRGFHEATAFVTVFTELVVVGMVFLPRIVRIVCFFFVTFLQVSIILTANYAFLNYLVLALGIFLIDDAFSHSADSAPLARAAGQVDEHLTGARDAGAPTGLSFDGRCRQSPKPRSRILFHC